MTMDSTTTDTMMNNQWLQVCGTYTGRPRFWVLGGLYLLIVGFAGANGTKQAVTSAGIACIGLSFVALHLRRQFGWPTAGLLPGFAPAHLAVGLGISALVWLAVPAMLVWHGHWPAGALAMHALAGLIFGLVAIDPRAILLLALMPVIFGWAALESISHPEQIRWLFEGVAWLTTLLLVTAVSVQMVAAGVLSQLGDRLRTVNDDLAIEPARDPITASRWEKFKLKFWDAVVARRLAALHSGQPSKVLRWRVPDGASLGQLTLVTLIVLGAMVALNYWWSGPGVMLPIVVPVTGVLLCMPWSSWRHRRYWMASEMLRPVTRQRYFGELAGAMAIDAASWTLVASVIGVVGCGMVDWRGQLRISRTARPPAPVASAVVDVDADGKSLSIAVKPVRKLPSFENIFGDWPLAAVIKPMVIYLAILWGVAALVYGVGLLTMRLRYWLPLTIAIVIGSMIAQLVGTLYYVNLFSHPGRATWLALASFPLACGVFGMWLANMAYRRWIVADLP